MTEIREDEDMVKLEKSVMRKRWTPKNLPKPKYQPLSKEGVRELYTAYFNNKMTIIFLMLQKKNPCPDSVTSLKAVIFLEDLYHHMLRAEYQQKYARVFQWLRLFFKRFPYVKPVQKRKAIEYLGIVYELFGFKLNLNI